MTGIGKIAQNLKKRVLGLNWTTFGVPDSPVPYRIAIVDISTLLKNIDIDKEILEDINIDKDILENIYIDIDKDIWKISISILTRTF